MRVVEDSRAVIARVPKFKQPVYVYPKPVWDEKKCKAIAKRKKGDGYNSAYPGYMGKPHPYGDWGEVVRLNGGTVKGDEWYQSIMVPFPEVAPGYEMFLIPTWGWHLRKKQAE